MQSFPPNQRQMKHLYFLFPYGLRKPHCQDSSRTPEETTACGAALLGEGNDPEERMYASAVIFRLCQWFSALLTLWPFSTVSHVVEIPTHIKLFSWQLHNYNLPNVNNRNVNILGYRNLQEGSWLTGWGSLIYVTFLSFEHYNSCRKCNDVQLIKTRR